MSTFTGLFGNVFNRDPRMLGRNRICSYGTVWVFGMNGVSSMAVEATFTGSLASQGAVANITAANTYVTICNLSGGGYFFGAVSPASAFSASEVATFRITVDGAVYTIASGANITGNASIYSAFRFFLGSLYDGELQTTAKTDVIETGPGAYSNFINQGAFLGNARESKGIMLHNDQILKCGFPLVRFDSSLIVECKLSSYTATVPYPRCSAQYQLD